MPGTWEGVCGWVLGRRMSLWDAVFEAAFLQVSRVLGLRAMYRVLKG